MRRYIEALRAKESGDVVVSFEFFVPELGIFVDLEEVRNA